MHVNVLVIFFSQLFTFLHQEKEHNKVTFMWHTTGLYNYIHMHYVSLATMLLAVCYGCTDSTYTDTSSTKYLPWKYLQVQVLMTSTLATAHIIYKPYVTHWI